MDGTRSEDAARPRTLTVRGRIVGVVVAVAAVGIFVSGFAAYAVERQRVLDAVEDRLLASVESVRFVVADGTWTGLEPALAAVVQQVNPDDNAGSMGVIDGRAALVPGIPVDVPLDRHPALVDRVVDETAGDRVVSGTYVAEDGSALRYIATPVRLAGDASEGIFVNAYDLRAELSEIDGAARVFTVAAIVMLAVLGVVAWVVAGRLLRPLRELRETAARITATASGERIPVRGRDDVSELTVTVNDMLDRLEGALESQRRLLDDVGHELKTPITIVRGHLELLDPTDPVEVREARELAIDELDRMSVLVGDLTEMTRLGAPAALEPVDTDVGDLTRAIVAKARAIAGAEVGDGPVADVRAVLDPARVTQAVLQLAQNAVTHGGGAFTIGSLVDPATAELRFTVSDRGPGISESQRERVFERFGRASEGRGARGSGLGLSIVEAIARAHGGRVELASTPGFGAAFTLVLPGRTPAAGDDVRTLPIPTSMIAEASKGRSR
ncbi:cell wall metabolism sensor histidine kinase WalK [Agromyces sp. C10]|uniref:sensor histidine kinase n=1 Tax=Agromyces sp. C10 TaxID=2935077 RepID=UPI00200B5DED|nr:HAMP domain-containing sensor histidine kinase [Agromyces sp. C10]MCK8608679.1 HAMP domain-containing histidine kinase [Agromyces sp. C10]